MQHGDLGVDMFFVLSGFLISFILYKECDKYQGQIDYFNFIRSRFLRLWPMILLYTIYKIPQQTAEEKPVTTALQTLSNLGFINNFIYPNWEMTHLWSTACEFQFYLLAPFLVTFMYKFAHLAMIITLLINVSSSLIIAMIIHNNMPLALSSNVAWVTADGAENQNMRIYFFKIYTSSYCRIGSFISGIYAGFLHSKYPTYDFTDGWVSVIFENIACMTTIAIASLGAWPSSEKDYFMAPQTQVLYICVCRSVYGIAFSYLILLMVTP